MLGSSFKIATICGIPVLLHWSFLLVYAGLAYFGYRHDFSLADLLWLGVVVTALFLCILLHEFGHALTARRFGVTTKDIILLPIGGMARLEKLPEKPVQEIAVAIAGPMVNFLIALLLLPIVWLITVPGLAERDMPGISDVIGDYFYLALLLFLLNFLLALFNLIPAFPMDGGRILRALLSMRFGRLKATRIASITGQLIAAAMVILGIWHSRLSYTLIGAFIYITANREYRWVLTETLLAAHRVAEVFRRELLTTSLTASIPGLREMEHASVFIVVDEQSTPVGTISKADIQKIDGPGPQMLQVKDHYLPFSSTISPSNTLKEANDLMQRKELELLPVYEDGKLAGILENEMIWEYLSGVKTKTGTKPVRS